MKKTVLRKYAQLIAASGVNVQPGQEVFIAGRSGSAGVCEAAGG